MTLFQFLMIQVNFLLFYCLFLLMNSGKRHLTVNRVYLLVVPFVAIILPFASYQTSEANNVWINELPSIKLLQSSLTSAGQTFDWLTLFYCIGTIVFILLIVYHVYKVIKHPVSEYRGLYKGSHVYLISEDMSSFSFMNRIYLNPYQVDNEETVLLHEYAHCAQWHTIDLLWMSILKALLWFNPIIYLWNRRLRENHEYLADQYVLQFQPSLRDYGKTLLATSFGLRANNFVNDFNTKSLLHKRIENLNHKNQYTMKQLVLVPVIAGLAFLSTSMNAPTKISTNEVTTSITEKLTPAEFPGGMEALSAFILSEIHYPKELEKEKASGKVYVNFEISKTGKVENIKIAQGSDYEALNNEALRVVQNMPDWKPATKNGKAVRSEMTLPFNFAID